MVNLSHTCRAIWRPCMRSLVLAFALSVAFMPATSVAVTPVDASKYALRIGHEVLSEVPLENGRRGLELRLTLRNGGALGLYDLRLFLAHAGPVALLSECDSAPLRVLPSGSREELIWTFDCLTAPLPPTPLHKLQFRIEAIDEQSQQVITFMVTSEDGP